MAFACFSCRKTFKHPYVEGEWIRKCAECGEESFNMGRKFRSPHKENRAEWKIIEFIARSGEWGNFRSASRKPLPFPRTLKEAKQFVEQIEKERILRDQIDREENALFEQKRKARKKRMAIRRKLAVPREIEGMKEASQLKVRASPYNKRISLGLKRRRPQKMPRPTIAQQLPLHVVRSSVHWVFQLGASPKWILRSARPFRLGFGGTDFLWISNSEISVSLPQPVFIARCGFGLRGR